MSPVYRDAAKRGPIMPHCQPPDSDFIAIVTMHDADRETEGKTTAAVNDPRIVPISSYPSHRHDAPVYHCASHIPIDDEVYNKFSPHRKVVMVILLSFCGFLAPISSTSVLPAVPEVAAEFDSSGTIINLSNALYLVFMGLSPCFWGPLSQVYGRRLICIITSALFLGSNIGTALSPNLTSFFVFRILTAFQGTSFLIVGASVLGDIYHPTQRATAMGWFLSGTLVGPAFGPFIGGIIVTFASWRVIFWLQSGLASIAVIGAAVILPETIHYLKATELEGLPLRRKLRLLWSMTNPWRVIRLLRYPNLLAVSLASSSLVWNMYSLLTPIRYILNPRFALTSPIQSGLFYLAPGFGYLFGTFFGGRWADYTTKRWIGLRGGERVAEDRLRSCVPFIGIVIPACMLLYGWSVEQAVGGIPLPVVVMFIQGVAQLFCFPSLNTYCLDVMQSHSAEVIAGNYMMRYMFAAMGTAAVLPVTQRIGVGWYSSISAAFMCIGALGTAAAIRWGCGWRVRIDEARLARDGNTRYTYGDEKDRDLRTEDGSGDVSGSEKERDNAAATPTGTPTPEKWAEKIEDLA